MEQILEQIKNYTAGMKAVEDLNPLFLQIHVNLMQELIMPEGSRNFNEWEKNIVDFVKKYKSSTDFKGSRLWNES